MGDEDERPGRDQFEDVDAANKVAEAVLDQHAGETGIVWIFFSYPAEASTADLRSRLRVLSLELISEWLCDEIRTSECGALIRGVTAARAFGMRDRRSAGETSVPPALGSCVGCWDGGYTPRRPVSME